MRKQRILWANYYCLLDTTSGASLSVNQILRELSACGYEISILGATVFDSENGAKLIQQNRESLIDKKILTINDGALSHRLVVTKSTKRDDMTSSEISYWYAQYLKTINEFRPDLVFFYGGQAADLLISQEARAHGIPSVAYLVNANYMGSRWCRDVDLVVTDSKATANLYKEKLGLNVIPCGKFIEYSSVVAREHLRKNLLFVNPSLQKGVGIVVQIAVMLESRRPDIKIEVVESRGNWNKFVEALSRSTSRNIELTNVVLTGNTNDMREIYSRARVLLAPSLWWESGSRVLAEAMLNGIPAIVSKRGGNPEMIGNGGIKVEFPEQCYKKPYDIIPKEEILLPVVNKIIQFYDDEGYYQEFVKRAYNVGHNLHNTAVSTSKIINAIKPLLSMNAGDLDQLEIQKRCHKHHLIDPHLDIETSNE